MAFNPVADYNIRDPYGTSPSQRLSQALANTSFQRRGARTADRQQRLDLQRSERDAFPKVETQFARRGLIDSGLRNRAHADLAAQFARARAQQQASMNQQLLQLALQDLAAQGQFAGTRFGRAQDATTSQAEMAAKIREAMG
tara:strand:+ start:87 stop:512 length:426 start_codon:yes stop_codon:yes gene_type:complete